MHAIVCYVIVKVPCHQWWRWWACDARVYRVLFWSPDMSCVSVLGSQYPSMHELSKYFNLCAPRSPSFYSSSHHIIFQTMLSNDPGRQVDVDGFFSSLFALPLLLSLHHSVSLYWINKCCCCCCCCCYSSFLFFSVRDILNTLHQNQTSATITCPSSVSLFKLSKFHIRGLKLQQNRPDITVQNPPSLVVKLIFLLSSTCFISPKTDFALPTEFLLKFISWSLFPSVVMRLPRHRLRVLWIFKIEGSYEF